MANNVKLARQVFGKGTYPRVIDTSFRQFVVPAPIDVPTVSVEDFFIAYDDLFYQIPIDGNVNSHKYLIQKSTDYVGTLQQSSEVQALLAEINQLRQEVNNANQIIADLLAAV
jgi:hypothetical protein